MAATLETFGGRRDANGYTYATLMDTLFVRCIEEAGYKASFDGTMSYLGADHSVSTEPLLSP